MKHDFSEGLNNIYRMTQFVDELNDFIDLNRKRHFVS